MCREGSVAGTPYTYHNGLAMFTSDTGQMTGQLTAPHPTLGLALQQVPGKATAQSSAQPLPLLYGPANTTAMFLPSASGTAISQQQIQLQTHINNVAAAVQSQVSVKHVHTLTDFCGILHFSSFT